MMPIVFVSTGSTSGIAFRPAGSVRREIHVCAVTPETPMRACAITAETEFVSTTGAATAPAAAKAPSMIRRCCMSGVSRHSGSVAASAQPTVVRAPNGPSAGVSSR